MPHSWQSLALNSSWFYLRLIESFEILRTQDGLTGVCRRALLEIQVVWAFSQNTGDEGSEDSMHPITPPFGQSMDELVMGTPSVLGCLADHWKNMGHRVDLLDDFTFHPLKKSCFPVSKRSRKAHAISGQVWVLWPCNLMSEETLQLPVSAEES